VKHKTFWTDLCGGVAEYLGFNGFWMNLTIVDIKIMSKNAGKTGREPRT
jgi:hypothetical protein